MKQVWKFDLASMDTQSFDMPKGAQVLSIHVQHDAPRIWALVDSSAPLESRTFHIYGTGHPIHHDVGRFVGTFLANDGNYVFHVWEGAQ